MMYPFLTMNDHTEIVYSHLLDGGGVKIYVEKPDEYDGFHHAACFLPGCRWEDMISSRRSSKTGETSRHRKERNEYG